MLYAVLLLGLIPAVLLPDFLAEQDDETDDHEEPLQNQQAMVSLLDAIPALSELSEERGLLPVDEDDLPGDPGSAGDAIDPTIEDDTSDADLAALDPVIEDDQPSGGPPVDLDDVQAPVIEDDSDQGYADPEPEDVLAPVIEDDVASADPQDEALPPVEELEAGEDGAYLNASDLASGSYAEISGFETGTDVLRISLDPDHDLPDLDVTVRASEDGTDSEVLIGDTLIAVLLDAPDVPVEDIIVTVQRLV